MGHRDGGSCTKLWSAQSRKKHGNKKCRDITTVRQAAPIRPHERNGRDGSECHSHSRPKEKNGENKMQQWNLWDAIRDTREVNNFAFILMNIFFSCSSKRNRLMNVRWEHDAHARGHVPPYSSFGTSVYRVRICVCICKCGLWNMPSRDLAKRGKCCHFCAFIARAVHIFRVLLIEAKEDNNSRVNGLPTRKGAKRRWWRRATV